MSGTTETLPAPFACWQSVDLATRRRIAGMAWHTERQPSGWRACVNGTGCQCPFSVLLGRRELVGPIAVRSWLRVNAPSPVGLREVTAFMAFADGYGAPGDDAPDPGAVPIPPAVMAAALGVWDGAPDAPGSSVRDDGADHGG